MIAAREMMARRAAVHSPLSRCIWPAINPRTLGATTGGAPEPASSYNLLTADGNRLLAGDGNPLLHGEG